MGEVRGAPPSLLVPRVVRVRVIELRSECGVLAPRVVVHRVVRVRFRVRVRVMVCLPLEL